MERPEGGPRLCMDLSVSLVDAVRALRGPSLSHSTPRGMGAMLQYEQRDDGFDFLPRHISGHVGSC